MFIAVSSVPGAHRVRTSRMPVDGLTDGINEVLELPRISGNEPEGSVGSGGVRSGRRMVKACLKWLAKHRHSEGESHTSEFSLAGGCRERQNREAGSLVTKGFTHVKQFGLHPNGQPLQRIVQCDLGQGINSIWAWFCCCLVFCLFVFLFVIRQMRGNVCLG